MSDPDSHETKNDQPAPRAEEASLRQRVADTFARLIFPHKYAQDQVDDNQGEYPAYPPEDLGYTPGTIEHGKMPRGGRNLATYEQELMFDRTELAGKRVLDLGAGPDVLFARELAIAGIKADVTSLSADFNDPAYLNRARQLFDGPIVAGLAQNLPFADASFDYIVALHIYEHLRSQSIMLASVQEMARVLAPGGIAKMGPTLGLHSALKLVNSDEQLAQYLKDTGVEIEVVQTPDSVGKYKVYDGLTGMGVGWAQPDVLVLKKAAAE